MKKQESNPASDKRARRRIARQRQRRPEERPHEAADDFNAKTGLDGKTDSGPEPDVLGREIPPQE